MLCSAFTYYIIQPMTTYCMCRGQGVFFYVQHSMVLVFYYTCIHREVQVAYHESVLA